MRGLLLFCALSPLYAVPAYVNGTSAKSANTVATVSVTYSPTSGNALWAGCGGFESPAATSYTITDSAGNNWALDKFAGTVNASEHLSLSHTTVHATGSITITCTSNGTPTIGVTLLVAEFSGNATVADGGIVSANTPSPSTSANSGAITTTKTNDLLIGLVFNATGSSCSLAPGSGWSTAQSWTATGPCTLLEYQIAASTGSYSATATMSNARWAAIEAAYKLPANGGGSFAIRQ